MKTWLILFSSLLLFVCAAQAKDGYEIEFQLENFDQDFIILASYYGKSNKIIDTIESKNKTNFIAKGDEALKGGIYLVILPPDNKYFELVIDKEQHFKMTCNAKSPTESMKVKGSTENQQFYDYLNFIGKKRTEKERLQQLKEKAKDDKAKLQQTKVEEEKLDAEVQAYFDDLKKREPNSINTLILKANQPVDVPEKYKGKDADEIARYYWFKAHYFDHLDLSDYRLFRTSFFHKRLDHYVEKMTVQQWDSINVAIDKVLTPMPKESDMFKYYLVYFLNKYAKSKIVGMDAVYVHLVNKYYRTGLAPWTDEETLEKILDDAKRLEPTLIGKTAPNFVMFDREEKSNQLHQLKGDYLILYFWDPDCGHCKKALPFVKDFHAKFKDKVRLISVCTEITKDVPKCWEAVDEKEINDFYNVVDPYGRYKGKYDLRSTPRIFILDKDKKIIMKSIGAEQLDEVMDKIIEQDQKKWEEKNN